MDNSVSGNLATIVRMSNPWWQGEEAALPSPYIPRLVQRRLAAWDDPSRIVVLTGPRQSGKSTLLRWWIRSLLEAGLAAQSIVYLNADSVEVRELIGQPARLLSFLEALPLGRPRFVLLDEIQRVSEPGLVLKQLVDLGRGIRFAVSGSASLAIRSQTREHLTGRKLDLLLPPLSYPEVVAADTELGALASASQVELERQWPFAAPGLQRLLERLAVYGGYPRVWCDPELASEHLAEIHDTYVRKDVVDFLRVDHPGRFNRLVRLLALGIGGLINKSSLATEAGLTLREIESYLHVLEDTHVALLVPPFFTNRRREVVRASKVFFLDTGLRNAVLGQLGTFDTRPDRGELLENLVISEVAKQLPRFVEQHFWRSQGGAEVDMVLVHGDELWAAEVKAGAARTIRRGFHSFIDTYRPRQAWLLNRDHHGPVSGAKAQALPASWFLLQLPSLISQLG